MSDHNKRARTWSQNGSRKLYTLRLGDCNLFCVLLGICNWKRQVRSITHQPVGFSQPNRERLLVSSILGNLLKLPRAACNVDGVCSLRLAPRTGNVEFPRELLTWYTRARNNDAANALLGDERLDCRRIFMYT